MITFDNLCWVVSYVFFYVKYAIGLWLYNFSLIDFLTVFISPGIILVIVNY